MQSAAVFGLQFGDEGKGKIVDFLSKDFYAVARFQGGNNAGHTIVAGNKTYKLHLLPSSIVRGKKAFLLGGMVLDLNVLRNEIDQFRIPKSKIMIDYRCHIILPMHIIFDKKTSGRIGTTCRGIGPCYADKCYRTGFRMEDLVDSDLKEKIRKFVEFYKKIKKIKVKENELYNYLYKHKKTFSAVIGDACFVVNKLMQKKKVLFEGAQGTFLDIDLGTYPYVTSSHPGLSGINAMGIPADKIKKIGVAKSYLTRVGKGPLVSETPEKLANKVRINGKEFGTTTGRPRRIAWLDLVMLRAAVRWNNIDELALTKLDVLSGLKKIRVAVAYKIKGKVYKDYSFPMCWLKYAKPIYKELKGFEINETSKFEELPKNAQNYINFISKELGTKISYISIGAERNKTIKIA